MNENFKIHSHIHHQIDDKKKIIIISLLLFFCCFLIYYFHIKLNKGTVFTHLFYIPIILASIWWRMAGFFTALFLGSSLIISHFFWLPHVSFLEDFLRASMFIIVSSFTIYLKGQINKAVEMIMLSGKKYRALFENMDKGVCIYKVTGDGKDFIFTDVNKAAEQIENMEREVFIGKSCLDIFPAIKDIGLLDVFHRVWRTGQPETHPLTFYKDERISGWRTTSVYKLSPHEIFCMYRDETLRIQAEETRIKLDAIVQSSNDAIIGITLEGIIQTWNKGAVNIFGYSQDEAIGSHVSIFVPEDRADESAEIISRVRKEERVERYETVRVRKDKKMINVSITASPIKNSFDKIIGASVITRDITEKNKLENQLRQAQKRQAIGTLAGGIAHDFNNILSPIIGFTEMTLDSLPKETMEHNNLLEVLRSADRARELIQHILTFSRESKQERKPLKVQYVIKEVLKLIRATLPASIKIRQNIEKDCGPALADPTQIHQIIMNLCTNAYHAMEENGGILEVSLKEMDISKDDSIAHLHIHPGAYIRMSVSDTGLGMDHSVIEKIFDPYFTTKEAGKGTGLGLAIVQGIIKNYGGDVSVYSETGKGSIFHVYLPRISTKVEPHEVIAGSQLPRGRERILLVDDEKQIVMMLEQMLQGLDYHVTTTTDSIKGFEIFKNASDSFDLVITDLDMPDMPGIQLAKNLMHIRPDIPIILCSGFSDIMSREKAKNMGISEFIMKPILKKDIAETIRKVLK